MAEQLQRRGLRVDLLEMQPQVLPSLDAAMAAPLEKELIQHGIGLYLGDAVVEFITGATGVSCLLRSGRKLEADIVILALGVKPESRLAAAAGLQLGERGHIVVDEFQRTSDPDIYAAGDVAETRDLVLGQAISVPLGGPANRQGRVAADHIFMPESARPYPGSLGTAIVRVFELAAGSTGWSEKQLERIGHPYHAVTVNDYHHASYYPGATLITLKILWEPDSGRLLGAQATGANGVDKRLDVLAIAIAGGMTVEDLCHLELAYSPPFGAAKDIVNIAGFAACNRRDGLVGQVSTLPDDPAVQLIDVRPSTVAEAHPAPKGALNIPFATLRANLHQLDRQRPVITLCALGKTSYFAARVLAQHGFAVKSLSGGLRLAACLLVVGPRSLLAGSGAVPAHKRM
jgi:rhodanese-related sulfurtransferase